MKYGPSPLTGIIKVIRNIEIAKHYHEIIRQGTTKQGILKTFKMKEFPGKTLDV